MTENLDVMSRVLATVPKRGSVEHATGVILSGGFGERMGSLVRSAPKPLLPVLNCPIAGWNFAQMRKFGIQEILLNTHYLASAFAPVAVVAKVAGINAGLIHEVKLSGPFGGALACGSVARKKDDLVVLAGDGLYEFDLSDALARHRTGSSQLTIGLAAVTDGSRYGVLDVGSSGCVTGMREKPAGVGFVTTASCGVYIVSPKLVERMQGSPRPIDWVDVVRILIREGAGIGTYPVDVWMDAGTPEDLLRLNLQALSADYLRLAADQIFESSDTSVWVQGDVTGMSDADLKGFVLFGADANLGEGSKVQNSVIGPGVRIGRFAEVRDSVVFAGASIPSGARVVDAILTG